MVQEFGAGAGSAEMSQSLSLCQKFAQAQVYRNLPELTRPDGGWPEQRRYLAQSLLGNAAYTDLVQAGDNPKSTGELLGYLALVVLSVAGRQSIDQQLDEAKFIEWRGLLAAEVIKWQPLDYTTAPAAAGTTGTVAAEAEHTAPWWPLLVLAVIGIASSSYFWNKQVAEASNSAMKAVKSAMAKVAPIVGFTSAPDTAEVAEEVRTAYAAAHRAVQVSAPANLGTAVLAEAPSNREQPVEELLTTKGVNLELADSIAALQSGAMPKVLPTLTKDNKSIASAPTGRSAAGTGSTNRAAESILYRRLMIEDLRKQQPITLDNIRFANGQTAIDAAGTYQLENIAALLKSFPNCKLTISGHAGTAESASLALDRANAVVALLRRLGVNKPVLIAEAYVRSEGDNTSDEAHSPTLLVNAAK
jgi:outer membrane protein OmpA-like peptidoglycan-associated protein